MLSEIRNAEEERIRRMLGEIQALGHADAHVATDAGNLKIPDDTSTETEAGLESNEEEEKRGGMSKRGGLEGVAGVCGSVGRGVVGSRTWMRLVVSCLRGSETEEGRRRRGRGGGRDGEGEGKCSCKGYRDVASMHVRRYPSSFLSRA
jgi:hypothetical protein